MGEEDEMPERMCILTREVKAPEAMVRFVRDPDNRVVPDLKAKLPGRGVWVTARAVDVAEAVWLLLTGESVILAEALGLDVIDRVGDGELETLEL